MFDLVDTINDAPVIKLIGVGGGGSNAVQHMVAQGIEGVDFICANTDAQALKSMSAPTVLHIGQSITKGLGAGANPEVGRQAAMEDRDRIQDIIQGTDMLFITAGMGGGTGTGAIPVVAQIAREMGVLTVAVVTRPFPFEGQKRMHVAQQGIDELRTHVDSLITIPNEKLLSVLGKNISLLDAFNAANDVLRGAVQGIAELITNPGLINVDFADVRTVMSEMGLAMMGSGVGRGDERATEAAEMAISSPLLEDIDLLGARGILVNITCGLDMAIGEFEEVGNVVRQFAADDATVVVGTAIDANLEGELRVTVVATGLGQQQVGVGINRGKATGTGGPMHLVSGQPQPAQRPGVATGGAPTMQAPGGARPAAPAGGSIGGSPYTNQYQPQQPQHRPANPVNRAPAAPQQPQGGHGQGHAQGHGQGSGGNQDMEMLDIPAFLRRQAD